MQVVPLLSILQRRHLTKNPLSKDLRVLCLLANLRSPSFARRIDLLVVTGILTRCQHSRWHEKGPEKSGAFFVRWSQPANDWLAVSGFYQTAGIMSCLVAPKPAPVWRCC